MIELAELYNKKSLKVKENIQINIEDTIEYWI
jgi:hypothetical protein